MRSEEQQNRKQKKKDRDRRGRSALHSSLSPLHADWFRRAFGKDYLLLYAHRDEREAERQIRLLVRSVPFQPGQKVLDLACGPGRHVAALARRGARVTGVDLSAPLLAEARKRLRAQGLRATLARCDMRRLPAAWRGRFDGAVSFFTSFGYFETPEEDLQVLRGIRRALKPGGWWLIDLLNGASLPARFVPRSRWTLRSGGRVLRIDEERRIERGFIVKRVEIAEGRSRRAHAERVRLYDARSFRRLLSRAGLRPSGACGDEKGGPLRKGSPRMLWYGTTRGARGR